MIARRLILITYYSMIFATTPAPTVRPPSRIAKRKPSSIAPIAMEDGLRFAIREGGRTVGAGVVAKIIE